MEASREVELFVGCEGNEFLLRLEEHFGVTALSDTELIAILLQGGGTRTEGAVAIASRFIAEAGSITGLATWVAADYRKLKGIGRSKGLQLAAITEVARRDLRSDPGEIVILVADPGARSARDALRGELHAWLEHTGDLWPQVPRPTRLVPVPAK